MAALCAAIGDTDGATQMAAEAMAWQRRVLRQWNANITSFDTVRVAPTPGPPPPPPPAPLPKGWTLLPGHNGMLKRLACRFGCVASLLLAHVEPLL